MPGWLTRRRLEAAERAALAASFDDPSFDPEDVLEAAGVLMERVLGRRTASGLAHAERVFGRIDVSGIGPQSPEGLDIEFYVEPEAIHVHIDRPRLRIASLERGEAGDVVRASVRAEARLRLWMGPWGPWVSRALTPKAPEQPTKRRLRAYWVFARGSSGWRLERVADEWWAEHELRTDPSGETTRAVRMSEETLVELAEMPSEEYADIPYEIACNLPTDPAAALAELALIDERFAPAVIEAAVRRLHDRREEEYGPRVLAVAVTHVHPLLSPPEIEVQLHVRAPGQWGAKVVRWRLAATTSPSEPWRFLYDDADPFNP